MRGVLAAGAVEECKKLPGQVLEAGEWAQVPAEAEWDLRQSSKEWPEAEWRLGARGSRAGERARRA